MTAIEKIVSVNNELDRLYEKLINEGEVSAATTIEEVKVKTLLLSSASHFESEICECIRIHCHNKIGKKSLISNFLEFKAINRQYHTWFSWNEQNANNFFALFGKEFSLFAKDKVNKDEKLDRSIKNFLFIGKYRNNLVHNNYILFSVDATAGEVMEKLMDSIYFIETLPSIFEEFENSIQTE